MKQKIFTLLALTGAIILSGCFSSAEKNLTGKNVYKNVPADDIVPSVPLQKGKLFQQEKYYCIYTPENPSRVQTAAAKELASYLKKLYTSPILFNGKKAGKGVTFYVGRTKENAKLFAEAPGMKEFGVFPALDNSAKILIDGLDDPNIHPWTVRGRTGTLLGVYYFLGKYAGAEFFGPGKHGEKLTLNTPLNVKKADVPIPSYPVRYIPLYSRSKMFQSGEFYRFFKKMLCNVPDYAMPDFYYMGPDWKKLAKKNPELLGIKNGKRYYGKDYDVPCLTNPEVLRLMTEGACKEIARRGKRCRNIRIFRDTSARICECKNCSKYKDISNYYYTFINRLAQNIHKIFPDVYVMTQEKDNYFYHVPEGIKKLENRFVIEISNGFPSSRNFTKRLAWFKEWNDAGAIVLFRQYHRVRFHWFDYPIIKPLQTARHYKFMQGKALGTRWCDGGDTFLPQCLPMQYMQAKFLFDASADEKEVLRKFCSLAYPGAEEEMMRYFALMENNLYAYPSWGNALEWALQYDNLIEPLSLLKKAMKKVKEAFWLAPTLADLKRVQDLSHKYRESVAVYNAIKRAFDVEYGPGKIFVAPRLEKDLLFTGKGDDPAWKKIPSFSFVPSGPYKTPFQFTRARMACSKGALFCSFKAFEEFPEKIASKEKNVWANDSMELMIAPPDKEYPYIQLLCTPNGVEEVIYYIAPGRSENLDKKCVAGKASIDLKEKCWTGEIVIPRKLLRNMLKKNTVRFGLFRSRNTTDKTLEKQWSGLYTGRGSFHRPDQYRTLIIDF